MANDIYESCRRFMRTQQRDVLDDLLEITFIHVPTSRVLKRARFYLRADDATHNWIRGHPTFSRGCWPVGLFLLHDWMWTKKFIDVESRKITDGGMVDPNVGTTYIRAELENFEDGVWFAPLVNFANTHLFDQLKQFYADSPEAQTDPQRIPQIIATERAKAAGKQQQTAIAQAQRQHLIQKPNRNVRVFIDESGDVGFRQIDDVYVFAPVIVPDQRYERVATALKDLRAKHWGANPPAEIHMAKIGESKRTAVRRDFAQIVNDNAIEIIGCTIEKRAFIKHLFRCHAAARVSEEYPLDLTWLELINDRNYRLQATTLGTTVELVILQLAIEFLRNGTSAVFTHDRKHREWMNNALNAGFERGLSEAKKLARAFFGLDIAPSLGFSVTDSKDEPCLWLSDWISELRAWSFHRPFSPELESIKPHMTFLGFKDDGVKCASKDIGGYADREFPDLPRELRRHEIQPESIAS
jgi:hypothetical protein